MSVRTLDIGEGTGTPVKLDYHVPFKFTGSIESVTITPQEQDDTSAAESAKAEKRTSLEAMIRDEAAAYLHEVYQLHAQRRNALGNANVLIARLEGLAWQSSSAW